MSLRTCGSCAACCDGWLKINIHGQEVSQGKPCPHSTGGCCRIYDKRPDDPCRQFTCGWIAKDSPLPEWMRPDLAKVIFLPAHGVWRNLMIDLAVPVGKTIPQRSLLRLKEHAERNNRPLIWTENLKVNGLYTGKQGVHLYGSVEFQQEMQQLIVEHDGVVKLIFEALAPSPAHEIRQMGINSSEDQSPHTSLSG